MRHLTVLAILVVTMSSLTLAGDGTGCPLECPYLQQRGGEIVCPYLGRLAENPVLQCPYLEDLLRSSGPTGCPYLDGIRGSAAETGCPYLDGKASPKTGCPYLDGMTGGSTGCPYLDGLRNRDAETIAPRFRQPDLDRAREMRKSI